MYMQYVNWEKIQSCTKEERDQLVPYIRQLIEVRLNIDQLGVQGFDQFLATLADPFEKVAAELIIQGYSPNLAERMLAHLLNTHDMENSRYLRDVIFTEFALKLQWEDNSIQQLEVLLLSYLGVEYLEDWRNNRPRWPRPITNELEQRNVICEMRGEF